MRIRYAIIWLLLLSSFCACEDLSEVVGWGYNADFGLIHTDSEGLVVEVMLDNGKKFYAHSPEKVEWASTPDTICRALVYHCPTSDNETALARLERVLSVKPSPLKEGEEMHADPVEWESMWVSANKSFLNMSVKIKAGLNANGELDPQRLGLVLLNTEEGESSKHYLQLFHEQRSVPENYSYTVYISVPIGELVKVGDEVDLVVNTYKGLVNKTIVVK